MAELVFGLVASLIAGLGARDQMLVAALAGRHGRPWAVLVIALAATLGTIWLASWAAALLGHDLAAAPRSMLAALALGLGAMELIVRRQLRLPAEPTRSLGAFALVLLTLQLTDGARFMLFALAVATGAPWAVGLGGAIGSGVILAASWAAGQRLLQLPLARVRRWLGIVLFLLALALGWSAR
jgi:putative Ca2+/H+ antiporter (TMEM165/GDT1 family)